MADLPGYREIMEDLQRMDMPELTDYIRTNEWDLGWEGFTTEQIAGFSAVVKDFILAFKAGGLQTG
jgi:hypothetical protein